MLSPAHLLLIERLLAILLVLMRATEAAACANPPSLRRTAARFALAQVIAQLERLRDSAPTTAQAPAPANDPASKRDGVSPIRATRPRATRPTTSARPVIDRDPHHGPPCAQNGTAHPGPSYARFVTIS